MSATANRPSGRPLASLARKLLHVCLLAVPLYAVLGTGCDGPASEYCELVCECTKCSDRALEECIIGVDRDIAIADAYECTDERTEYDDCRLDSYDCDERDNVDTADPTDCADEFQDLNECLADASDLLGGLTSGAGPGAGATVASSATSTSGAGSTVTSSTGSGGGAPCCRCSCSGSCGLPSSFTLPNNDSGCSSVCGQVCTQSNCGSASMSTPTEDCTGS